MGWEASLSAWWRRIRRNRKGSTLLQRHVHSPQGHVNCGCRHSCSCARCSAQRLFAELMPHHTQGLRFLPGDPLTVTCDFNSSERDQPTPAGSGSKVRVVGAPINYRPAALPAAADHADWVPLHWYRVSSELPSVQNEMCNMYMMVTSEIPYFMACGNR